MASLAPRVTVVVDVAEVDAAGMPDGLAVVPPSSEMTLVVLMVLRYVELVGQLVMSGGHAVTVMTFVMVVVDLDIGVEDDEVVTEATTGPVSVLNTVRGLVGRVEVAIDLVRGSVYPSKRLTFAHS